MEVLYEDNHIIIVNKAPGEIVQGDKTGDKPLVEIVKDYLKVKYNKPGNVFCGVAENILGNNEKRSSKAGRNVGALYYVSRKKQQVVRFA